MVSASKCTTLHSASKLHKFASFTIVLHRAMSLSDLSAVCEFRHKGKLQLVQTVVCKSASSVGLQRISITSAYSQIVTKRDASLSFMDYCPYLMHGYDILGQYVRKCREDMRILGNSAWSCGDSLAL
ncbi:Hypothetical predicted protein [Podarcis lilfordi]|uniref:Uncharacterized protein n=1 Tax=Podarcis lilfordi TaxID=74358 RepID=A0AA35JXF4_9SAUR|nr:Hypothetical predicted protein [Podarcis lilfordi]